jgi:NAD(P)-dependent dehydrogenase (short-subunit alcohol dehydrogenase family)
MRALVTGGAKRLGREMALYLAARGLDVVVHYNSSASEAEDIVSEIRSLGRNSFSIKANLLDESQVVELVPEAVKQLGGPLTMLVNNASIFELIRSLSPRETVGIDISKAICGRLLF